MNDKLNRLEFPQQHATNLNHVLLFGHSMNTVFKNK